MNFIDTYSTHRKDAFNASLRKGRNLMRGVSIVSLLIVVIASAAATAPPDTAVWSPRVVAVPPADAYIGLSLLETGEIRHYNYGEQAEPGSFYLSSTDNGHTWKKVNTPKEIPFADTRSPLSGEYIRLIAAPAMGTFALRTDGGIGGSRTLTKISDTMAIMLKPPVFIRNGTRVVVAGHYGLQKGLPRACFTFVSDDDGRTWTRSSLVTTPDHTGGGFHNGIRWNHGAAEPTVVELRDGRLWMLIRTSQDHHYQSFSDDGGETWCASSPSPFYGTITMPTIGRLKDGRLLFLWSNTTPLPEVNNTDGVWDDVFTNRNAIHAAVSADDGKTWTGFRELYLDPRRNASDFGTTPGIDKSVHQSQFVETGTGKILVSLGQHPLHRKMLLFDVDWLNETERRDDFSDGLQQWSVFSYYKGIVGHCGYNRMQGCDLTTDGKLRVRYIRNDSLLTSRRGAVWNFPALRRGRFSVSVCFLDACENAQLLLNDRWFNPTDSTAAHFAPFVIPFSRKSLKINDDKPHTVCVEWDLDTANPVAVVFVDNRKRLRIPLSNASLHGLSYVHFLSDNRENDNGFVVEWVKTEKNSTR